MICLIQCITCNLLLNSPLFFQCIFIFYCYMVIIVSSKQAFGYTLLYPQMALVLHFVLESESVERMIERGYKRGDLSSVCIIELRSACESERGGVEGKNERVRDSLIIQSLLTLNWVEIIGLFKRPSHNDTEAGHIKGWPEGRGDTAQGEGFQRTGDGTVTEQGTPLTDTWRKGRGVGGLDGARRRCHSTRVGGWWQPSGHWVPKSHGGVEGHQRPAQGWWDVLVESITRLTSWLAGVR